MSYLVPANNETLTEFFERVRSINRCADNNGERRPKLAKMFRRGYKIYLEERKRAYHENLAQKLMLEGAGTREGKHVICLLYTSPSPRDS